MNNNLDKKNPTGASIRYASTEEDPHGSIVPRASEYQFTQVAPRS